MNINKQILYFLIATIPVMIQTDAAPTDPWGWFKLCSASLLAGLVALKALQSDLNTPSQ